MPDQFIPANLAAARRPRIKGTLGRPLKITRTWESRTSYIHAVCIGDEVIFIKHPKDVRPKELSQVEVIDKIPYCIIRLSLDERIRVETGSDSVRITIKEMR